MKTILLVEDNRDLALGLRNNLEIEGYEVLVAEDGEQGIGALEQEPALIVLDLMLPDINGLEVLAKARKQGFEGPVLVLTARGEEGDKVRALRLGADDYVTKPFGLLELLARIEVLLRRVPSGSLDLEIIHYGGLEVRPGQRRLFLEGEEVNLTPKEFDLLIALLRVRGTAVSRDQLLVDVWGYQQGVYTRTVDTHVAELRRKIEADVRDPRYILTVRAVGYRMPRAAPTIPKVVS